MLTRGGSPSPCRPLLQRLGIRRPLNRFGLFRNTPASYRNNTKFRSQIGLPKERGQRLQPQEPSSVSHPQAAPGPLAGHPTSLKPMSPILPVAMLPPGLLFSPAAQDRMRSWYRTLDSVQRRRRGIGQAHPLTLGACCPTDRQASFQRDM